MRLCPPSSDRRDSRDRGAGLRVMVKGTLSGTTITVNSVAAAKP